MSHLFYSTKHPTIELPNPSDFEGDILSVFTPKPTKLERFITKQQAQKRFTNYRRRY